MVEPPWLASLDAVEALAPRGRRRELNPNLDDDATKVRNCGVFWLNAPNCTRELRPS